MVPENIMRWCHSCSSMSNKLKHSKTTKKANELCHYKEYNKYRQYGKSIQILRIDYHILLLSVIKRPAYSISFILISYFIKIYCNRFFYSYFIY
jgi:hypothetical protein